VARDSLARSRFLSFVMEGSSAVLIRRGMADRAALRAMAAHLSAEDLVAVYPEGTRSSDGRLGEFRPGGLLAARLAGVPIVPAAIRGTEVALGRHARVPRLFAPVAIRFGEAIDSGLPDALERARAAVEGMLAEGGAAGAGAR
jgi:1-acyl-sn-glycerol-3-phosphate acyltransferase